MKNYTHNWSGEFINNTRGINNLDLCLEIGSFEGLTSNYIVDNILSTEGKLICIDPLTDVYLNDNLSELDIKRNNSDFVYFKDQYSRFINNVKEHLESNKIELVRDLSTNIFPELIKNYKNKFDFIYIDGDHRSEGVYIDAINSFELIKKGGLILFDDYLWEESNIQSTKIGIDKFLDEYSNNYRILIKSYQVLIEKL
jgi:predicted O-methyltransferase YrrM